MLMTAAAAAVLAVVQFLLDTALFRLLFANRAAKAIGLLLAKLALYAGGFALLFLCFRQYVTGAAIGFGVGFFPAILVYGLLFAKRELSVGRQKSEVGSRKPNNRRTENRRIKNLSFHNTLRNKGGEKTMETKTVIEAAVGAVVFAACLVGFLYTKGKIKETEQPALSRRERNGTGILL